MPDGCRLDRASLARSTIVAAQRLVGCLVVSERGDRCAGRIVETEAYLGTGDLASHAATRRTGRVAIMSEAPGLAYVYRSYGLHAMLNVVAKPAGGVGAVLIRAVAPVDGLDTMRQRRGVTDDRLLCRGPGRLCQAMGIMLDDHGVDLVTADDLYLIDGSPPNAMRVGPRIGISRGVEHPYRFFEAGSPFVSAHQRGNPIDIAATRDRA